MPPPLPTESDTESVVEEVPNSKPATQVEEEVKAVALLSGAEGEDDDDDDEDSETYIVEKILDHHDRFKDHVMRYQIKWKGYDNLEVDTTWETEENLDGAREILLAYWESIGGKPEPSKATSSGKKRGRRSTGGAAQPAKKSKKVGRKSITAAEDPDATPEPPPGYTDVDPSTWKPPTPNDGVWDPLVMNVDTIEKDDKDELWAYLVWNEENDDGRFNRSKARLTTCNKACPQRMLQFYEKHVVFTNNKDNHSERNGA